ncbi:GNAT family N-acetyltransferase [Mycoplasmatota bacterium]|nr:GNAT family N-acetyltransferase [Mycoplasmatota bacterium]
MRKTIISDNKEVKQFLGINSSNITSVLPIKNRNFNIWFLCSDNDQIIGFLSFDDMDNDVKFIKSFYIVPTFRKRGYAKYFINNLHENYSKLECRINPGINIMYKLVKSVGMRGEKSTFSKMLSLDTESH